MTDKKIQELAAIFRDKGDILFFGLFLHSRQSEKVIRYDETRKVSVSEQAADDWAKTIGFESYDDIEEIVYKKFPRNQLAELPLSFWENLQKLKNLEQLFKLIKEQQNEFALFVPSLSRSWAERPIEEKEFEKFDAKEDSVINIREMLGRFGILRSLHNPQLSLFDHPDKMKTLTAFDKKLFFAALSFMQPDGSTSIFTNINKLLKMLGYPKNGYYAQKVFEAVYRMSQYRWRCTIPLPPLKQDGKTSKKWIEWQEEPLLNFMMKIVERKPDGTIKKSALPIAYLPRAFQSVIKANVYMLRYDKEMLKLPDNVFVLGIHLQEFLRINLNSQKKSYSESLDKLLLAADWNISVKQAKHDLKRLHEGLNILIEQDVIKNFSIKKRGKKQKLPLTWYESKNIKLTIGNRGEQKTNTKLFESIIYTFEWTENFFEKNKIFLKESDTLQIPSDTLQIPNL
jgi:hypothetical protein